LCYRGPAIWFHPTGAGTIEGSAPIALPIKHKPQSGVSSTGRKIQMTSGNSPGTTRQSKIAAASGWIGSALEYYDFFIYATAASLVFPQIFFSSQNPTVAIVASLATYGVGYVARPIGACVLGHWGDTHGRKNVLVLCMFLELLPDVI